MSREEFVCVVAYLSAACNKNMPPEQSKVYFELLADLPGAAVLAAAKQCVLEGDGWIPPVGKLRVAALAALRPRELTWGEAWDAVMLAADRHGETDARGYAVRPESLPELPPRAAWAARAVGWRSLVYLRDKDRGTVRAQFRDLYQSAAEIDQRAALLPPAVREMVAQLAASGLKLLTEEPGVA